MKEGDEMIIDRLENLKKYIDENDMRKIDVFLKRLSPEMEEGRYEIDGDDIYARVMSYHTSPREDCKIEAHDLYIDIQSTLVGKEGIDVFHREELIEKIPYNAAKDVCIYEESAQQYITVDNLPDYFSMLYPEEAHKPQISLDKKRDIVKKFVIKIKRNRVK